MCDGNPKEPKPEELSPMKITNRWMEIIPNAIYCWTGGIPSINGICVYCGMPIECHRGNYV